MRHRRKRPSQLRCLVPVLTVAPVLVVLWAMNAMLAAACQPNIPCPALPPVVTYILLAVFALGLLASCVWAYRDFVQGQYWIDLHNSWE